MSSDSTTLSPAFGGEVPARQWPRWWVIAALSVMVLVGAGLRIHYTYAIDQFDRESSAGYLQTDSAFLAYLTDRIVDAGGGVPPDFRADTRIEHPEPSDALAMFTVGQEFVIAWAKLLVGDDVALHVVAVWVMSLFAALTVLGVWGVGRELSGSRAFGLAAALVWMVLPASYRTLGFVFIREDFSLPIYALHLWLVLRAVRHRTPASFVAVGVSAALAAATWHAMGQFLAIEVACFVLWFLRTGQNPLTPPRAWLALLAVVLLSLAVPVLRAKGFALSAPVAAALALGVAAAVGRRWPGRRPELLAFGGALVLIGAAGVGLSRISGSGLNDFAHVFELLWDKVRYLGQMPADPTELAFDTRVLWQGPFVTGELAGLALRLGPALLAVAVAVGLVGRSWITGRGDGRTAVWVAFAAASCVAAWLIQRTYVLTAITGSATVAAVLAMPVLRRAAPVLLLAAVVCQGWILQSRILSNPRAWWTQPRAEHVLQRAHLVDWVEHNVPLDDAVASDFVTGACLLYHTRRPSLLQPKYETVRSRRRIEDFFTIFYHRKPADLRAWMVANDCRWFALNHWWMWQNRYIGGLPMSATRPADGSTAAWFLSRNPKIYARVPGFELAYESPEGFGLSNFRVYRLRPR